LINDVVKLLLRVEVIVAVEDNARFIPHQKRVKRLWPIGPIPFEGRARHSVRAVLDLKSCKCWLSVSIGIRG